MRTDLEGRLHIVSNLNIPENLRRRIRGFARDGRIYPGGGSIEVKKVEEHPKYYSVSLVLHGCVEDEMGARSVGYKDLRFDRRYSSN
jgi:hypothetical protein